MIDMIERKLSLQDSNLHHKTDLASSQAPLPLDQLAYLISPIIRLITNNAVVTAVTLNDLQAEFSLQNFEMLAGKYLTL